MTRLTGFGNVVLPARDLIASVDAWTALLGQPPAFQSDDFAAFSGDGVEIGLTAAPWVDHPLVFWTVEDIEQAHAALVAAGATAMTEVSDGSLAEVGTADAATGDNIDPATGIVDMPGARLAVLKAADGNLVAITQEIPMEWAADQP
ncbi:Glyoxalase/bleomycin resistance protein/dioxygenase [Beutenbergia cavernae DSM 12333]|uniref:Glyoxalase/bleomycin resistance protein/dioxygenase n=1 Tax=Beutenbergia cavernae (strain ATCC BAA-8 / DSM 12333 / CCUG 43141 / JCM 11478 / NBRC 16432 / NCIMB 13614 / HKI 0122) TaxID=471853 RepID=C5C551_BEUC1|nr:VOC family protein [Beutenbergia cavernae]ACQ82191.1 Glyoxalase/bleomycin resistance protein/dioxygenase [Beutenbergia cavernae DSM 12333]